MPKTKWDYLMIWLGCWVDTRAELAHVHDVLVQFFPMVTTCHPTILAIQLMHLHMGRNIAISPSDTWDYNKVLAQHKEEKETFSKKICKYPTCYNYLFDNGQN